MSRTHSTTLLLAFVAVCLAVGAAGSFATMQSVTTWYPTLAKPAWNPPAAVFGPVWTMLYILMGIAGWLAWTTGTAERTRTMIPFGIQLALNAAWSFLFFGLRQPGWAALEILLLWLAIVWTVISFKKVRTVCAVLLAPYLLWVTFAAALNVTIWRLN